MIIKKKKQNNLLETLGSYSSQTKLMIIMNIALIVGAFVLGNFYGQLKVLQAGGTLANNPSPAAAAPAADPETPLTDDSWNRILENPAAVKGPQNAAVTIVEFTDYQCPFCNRHFQDTDPQVQANYVDTGKVRYMIRDLPLPFHTNANPASQAARCAGDQNKYWEMHDVLFENQTAWGELTNPQATFEGYAQQIGINTDTFASCLSSEKYKQAVDDDLALATQVGANATPTFYVNGKPIIGAQPYAAFEAAIEEALGN